MTNNLHAHVSTASSDCDGPMYRTYVTTMRDDEKTAEFGDLDFKERVLGNHVSFHSEAGVEVKVCQSGFTMHEQTDEGYRAAEIYWCEDDCDEAASWQRDVFAEQMGY